MSLYELCSVKKAVQYSSPFDVLSRLHRDIVFGHSFDLTRSGCEHSGSLKSVYMRNKHGGSIRFHDCYLKRCVKSSLQHNTVFLWWNLRFPATAPVIFIGLLRLKKRSTEKKTPRERRLPKATDSKGYAWSDTDLNEVLFHYAMFCDKENRDLSSKIYCFNEIS